LLLGLTPSTLQSLHDRPQQIDPVHVRAVHRRGRDPGEPAAEVDVLPRQRFESGFDLLVLHEHRVDELDESAAVAVLVAVRAMGGVVFALRVEVEKVRSSGRPSISTAAVRDIVAGAA
jgi:hypothetical protein